jgi:hypothetical protein
MNTYELPTYKELLDLADICFSQSGLVVAPELRAELLRMGIEYERRAGTLKYDCDISEL